MTRFRGRTPAVLRGTTLRVLGTTVTLTSALKDAAQRALGLTLEFLPLDGTLAQRMAVMEPDAFDIYDQWFHDLELTWPARSLQPIELARVASWDGLEALPPTSTGRGACHAVRGSAPGDSLYVQADGSLGATRTGWVSMLPTVHNADGFALVGGDDRAGLDSWADLLRPSVRAGTAFQRDAAIGAIDAALALQAIGELEVTDPGNLSLAEVDGLVEVLHAHRRAGTVQGFWADERSGLERFVGDEPLLASMWWSGLVWLRARGVSVHMITPREGYRGWFGGLALSCCLSGRRHDAAYALLNWWLDGEAGALMTRHGNYTSNLAALRQQLKPHEWAFWYEGQAAEKPIEDDVGNTVFALGEVREGGAYGERMRRVRVWNTIMDEHNYLVRRWERLVGAD